MNWTNSGLFRPISDRIELNRPISRQIEIEEKKKKKICHGSACSYVNSRTVCPCVSDVDAHPWRRTHAFPE